MTLPRKMMGGYVVLVVISAIVAATGLHAIVGAMENIRQATTQNATGTRQTEQAAQNLSLLGERLRGLIERVPA
jgi:methyl-accepting chemotaxis protein